MTTIAVMAVRSRSSLRVSERRDPHPLQNQPRHAVSLDENADARPPPSKRPRLHPPRGRRSSSDHLDATVDHPPLTPSSRPSPAKIVKQQTLRRYFHQKPQQNHPSPIAPVHPDGGSESPDPLHTDPPANAPSPAPASTLTPTSSARPHPKPAESHPTTATPSAAPPSTTPSKDLSAKSAVPEQRRSLRSHDGGSRTRSELALYFPNYEQLLSFETPKTDLLNPHTSIKVIDDLSEPPILSDESADALPFGNPLTELQSCETITLELRPEDSAKDIPKEAALEPPEQDTPRDEEEDPLNETVYFRAHRRHERQEKQLRNIERERAQHEKQQLDRLLDELRSHDWLRVMGITGHVTDAEKRHYESKRDLFVSELSALIQKLKIWKEEEKRRKLEREQKPKTSANHNADADTIPQSSPKGGASDDLENDRGNDNVAPTPAPSDAPSYNDLDPNDVDACAARQLHQEAARSATTTAPTSSRRRAPKSSRRKASPVPASSSSSHPRKDAPKAAPPPPPPAPSTPPPDPNRPFTSFFSKPHLREAALSLHRTGGRRTRLAFGQPLPDMEMGEFELPAEILTPEAIDSCRRERRRRKRANRG